MDAAQNWGDSGLSLFEGDLLPYKRYFSSEALKLIGYLVPRGESEPWLNQEYSYQNLKGERFSPQRGFTREVYLRNTYPVYPNRLAGAQKIEIYGFPLINGCPDLIKKELLGRYEIDKAVYIELKEMQRTLLNDSTLN